MCVYANLHKKNECCPFWFKVKPILFIDAALFAYLENLSLPDLSLKKG